MIKAATNNSIEYSCHFEKMLCAAYLALFTNESKRPDVGRAFGLADEFDNGFFVVSLTYNSQVGLVVTDALGEWDLEIRGKLEIAESGVLVLTPSRVYKSIFNLS